MAEQLEGQPVEEHEGEKYLRLLGLENKADEPITLKDGTTIETRNFLDVCGQYARPMLVGLEAMESDDPRREDTMNALRGMISQYIEPGQAE